MNLSILVVLSLFFNIREMKPCRQNRYWLLKNIVFSPQERIDFSTIAHFLKSVVHCFFRFNFNLFATDGEEISLKQLWKKHKPWALASGLRQLTWVKPRNTRKVWQYWPLSTFPNLWDPLTGGCKGGFFNQICGINCAWPASLTTFRQVQYNYDEDTRWYK